MDIIVNFNILNFIIILFYTNIFNKEIKLINLLDINIISAFIMMMVVVVVMMVEIGKSRMKTV